MKKFIKQGKQLFNFVLFLTSYKLLEKEQTCVLIQTYLVTTYLTLSLVLFDY